MTARSKHITLTSHPTGDQKPIAVEWGASTAEKRGPIVATPAGAGERNAIGSYSGSYAVYRALAVAAGNLDPLHKPDLTNTAPAMTIGPFDQWNDPKKIVSMDPWGHMVGQAFIKHIQEGVDVRPTIAVTRARLTVPEMASGIDGNQLKPDGEVLLETGEVNVT